MAVSFMLSVTNMPYMLNDFLDPVLQGNNLKVLHSVRLLSYPQILD